MENKYYTPSINEFHPGFEYEIDGEKQVFTSTSKFPLDLIEDWILCKKHVRVKCLDREDIESLGWYSETVLDIWSYEENDFVNGFAFRVSDTDTYVLVYDDITHYLGIYLQEVYDLVTYNFTERVVFSAKIKNKSELKRLMVQLGILADEKL